MSIMQRLSLSQARRSRAAPRSVLQSLWAPTQATGFQESTYAEMAWGKSQGAARRWAIAGAVVGTGVATVLFAPAAWLANAVASATDQRLLLTDARGTVWNGSAVAVLTGGPGSKDASALPGRLAWTLGPRWWREGPGLLVNARHACCLNGTVGLMVRPGLGRVTASVVPQPGWLGAWPTALLSGLGTPWNTLELGGTIRVSAQGLTLASEQGRWRVLGQANVELSDVSSRLSTLPTLGSYRLTLSGEPGTAGNAQLTLQTLDGALQLSGNGVWNANGIRFRGEATAGAADEAALSNLLNIIGRRDGARSVITIG